MEELKDIKPLVEIPDISLYVFIALVFVALLVLVVCIILLLKWLKKRKHNVKKEALLKLKSLDFKDAKKDAYTITKYALVLVDTEELQKVYEKLAKNLEKYKYKKEVPSFNEEDKEALKKFLGICNA